MDWGSFPDWIAALAASVALLFARSAVMAANHTNQSQAAQVARLEEEARDRVAVERRAQADKVAAWLVIAGSTAEPSVRFVNHSGLPIYDAVVTCSTPWGDEFVSYPAMSPQASPHELRWVNEKIVEGRAGAGEERSWQDLHSRNLLPLTLTFTDVGGRRWRREDRGDLNLLTGTTDSPTV